MCVQCMCSVCAVYVLCSVCAVYVQCMCSVCAVYVTPSFPGSRDEVQYQRTAQVLSPQLQDLHVL